MNKVQRIFLIIFLFCVFTSNFLYPQKKKVSKDWQIDFTLGSVYDDNILKNSEKYLERFMNHEDEGRFHISTYDDLIFQYSIGLKYNPRVFKKYTTSLSIGFDQKLYSINSVKSWYKFDLGIRQNLWKNTSMSFTYTHIPDFYVRHFRDDDWVEYLGYVQEAFQPYSFAKDDYSLWFQHKPMKDTRIRYYLTFMQYYHNEHYTEYDCNNYLIGFRVYQDFGSIIDINAGYKYVYSKGVRVDENPDINEISSFVDPTYDEHIATFGVSVNLPKIFKKRNSVSLTGNYYRRFYKTDMYYELDPLHAGRFDYNYRIYLNYKLTISSDISVTAFYNWLYRLSSSAAEENQDYISDEKDYNQNLIGMKFSYRIKF